MSYSPAFIPIPASQPAFSGVSEMPGFPDGPSPPCIPYQAYFCPPPPPPPLLSPIPQYDHHHHHHDDQDDRSSSLYGCLATLGCCCMFGGLMACFP